MNGSSFFRRFKGENICVLNMTKNSGSNERLQFQASFKTEHKGTFFTFEGD